MSFGFFPKDSRRFLLAVFGLCTLFIGAVRVIAWTGPTQSPPNGNVPAPINVGTSNQVKNGGLSVNALTVFGSQYVQNSLGVAVASPSYTLDVNGTARVSGSGLYNAYGYQMLQGNANDWLRINQNQSFPSGIAMYGNIAMGTGGLTVGSWGIAGNGNINASGNISASQFCIGASCISSWPSGGAQWTSNGSAIYYNSGTVSVGTSQQVGQLLVLANGRAISASSQGAGDWSGCFGSDCTGGTATQYGVYANGSVWAGDFSGNVYVTGNIYSGSRGMYMSEAARDDGAQFWYFAAEPICPSGSLVAGLDEQYVYYNEYQYTYVDAVLCQSIN